MMGGRGKRMEAVNRVGTRRDAVNAAMATCLAGYAVVDAAVVVVEEEEKSTSTSSLLHATTNISSIVLRH